MFGKQHSGNINAYLTIYEKYIKYTKLEMGNKIYHPKLLYFPIKY